MADEKKPASTAYRDFGSCQVQTWGGYVHMYQRGERYMGDVAFFEGDRTLDQLKEMHEELGRAIVVLEAYQQQEQREVKEAEEAVKTRFDRCNE